MDEILYEVDGRVGIITLNRPEVANAQNSELLDALDAAWSRAAADEDVKVVLLKANGKHFSSGHDLKDRWPAPKEITLEWIYSAETRRYLEYTLRWRNVPKPTIAAVQGKCIAGGLMLCWPCDLIVAAENAEFSDPVVHMGIGESNTTVTPGSWARARRRRSSSPDEPSPPRKRRRSAW